MVSVIQEEKDVKGLEGLPQHGHSNHHALESSAYSLFILAMRSTQTKQKYLQRFGYFLDFAQVATENGDSIEVRCNKLAELAKSDCKWLLNCIFNYLQLLKTRVESKEIKASTLRNNIKPIKLFCEQIDIDIPWKKLMRGMPKERKYAIDRAPTIEEITRISEYPDRRIKPIIYTMVSSGMRLGGWDYLKWKDVSPIIRDDKVIAAKIRIYSDEEDEYFSFVTPEAFQSLDNWMKYRKDCGENVNENSWVMRNLWDVTTPKGKGVVTIPKKLKSTGVKRLIENALWAQRVRIKLEEGKKRHDFQADHGLRKWFKTRCEIAGMKSIYIEILMNHSIGISDSYLRATSGELLNEYLKAVDYLTISHENKLILENQQMKINNESLQRQTDELNLLRKQLAPLLELKSTLIKEGILQEENDSILE
jgi:hypothetical protein